MELFTGTHNYRAKRYIYIPDEIYKGCRIIDVRNEKLLIDNKPLAEPISSETVSEYIEQEDINDLNKLLELMPVVADDLSRYGLIEPWVKFHELVAQKLFCSCMGVLLHF